MMRLSFGNVNDADLSRCAEAVQWSRFLDAEDRDEAKQKAVTDRPSTTESIVAIIGKLLNTIPVAAHQPVALA